MGKIAATFFTATNNPDLKTKGIRFGYMFNFCHTLISKEMNIINLCTGLGKYYLIC